MEKRVNLNQTSLDFGALNLELENKKEGVRRRHGKKHTLFCSTQTSLNSLIKLTYDITDKDFEYLYAYIMRLQGFKKVQVLGGYGDQGIDVRGLKDGIWYFFQCKQWSELYINPKQAGKFIGVVHHYQKRHPRGKFIYVTTSYPNKATRELLEDNQIEIIDNKGLIKTCESLGILTNEGWEKMIKEIQIDRMNDIQKSNPHSGFEELKRMRINEVLNHIPNYKGCTINVRALDKQYPFFQYWNLA